MKQLVQNFVESLREELKQYGELLALLEAQQQQVIRQSAHELVETVAAINAQGEAIRAARLERAQRQRELSQAAGLPAEERIGGLLPVLPSVYRPLIEALVEENNELLVQVRQRARQNHLLLSRAVELMEKFISSFCALGAPTYTQAGAIAPVGTGRALYEETC